MENEIWKDIIGYEGLYQVSNLGRVKRLKDDSIKKPFLRMGSKYLAMELSNKGVEKKHFLHRLVAIHFIPNPANQLQVRHIDGNINDNRTENLQWKNVVIKIWRKRIPLVEFIEGEIWREISGYEGCYWVSNLGRVKSADSIIRVSGNGSFIRKGRILRPNMAQYLLARLYHKTKSKTLKIHRLVAMAFIPNPENKPFVNHKDFNKHNNNVANLEWCTMQENIDHFNLYGGRLPSTKRMFTKEIISEMFFLKRVQNMSGAAIARKFKISRSTIYPILRREIYREIEIPKIFSARKSVH